MTKNISATRTTRNTMKNGWPILGMSLVLLIGAQDHSFGASIDLQYGDTRIVNFEVRGFQTYSTGLFWYNTYVDSVKIPGTITIGNGKAVASLDYNGMTWTGLGSCKNSQSGDMIDCINGLISNARECVEALETAFWRCQQSSWCAGYVTGSGQDRSRTAARTALRGLGALVTGPDGKVGKPLPPGDYTVKGDAHFKNGKPAYFGWIEDDAASNSATALCLYDVVNVR